MFEVTVTARLRKEDKKAGGFSVQPYVVNIRDLDHRIGGLMGH